MSSIVVVGSVNLDIVARVSRLPQPGETVTDAQLARYPGGKGANQALAARRLGAEVRFIGCVGDDAAADEALALLRAGGVQLGDCQHLGGGATGTALIGVTDDGENHIIVAPGANRLLQASQLRLDGADALICQLEVPADVVAAAVRDFAGFVCVNLAPARRIDVAVLQSADLLVVNETEAAWYGDTLKAAGGLVAVTYGGEGAELRRDGVVVAAAQPPAVDVVDTTGAGDTFTAAITVALSNGKSEQDALEFACTAGALATTRHGAQPSLPSYADVIAAL